MWKFKVTEFGDHKYLVARNDQKPHHGSSFWQPTRQTSQKYIPTILLTKAYYKTISLNWYAHWNWSPWLSVVMWIPFYHRNKSYGGYTLYLWELCLEFRRDVSPLWLFLAFSLHIKSCTYYSFDVRKCFPNESDKKEYHESGQRISCITNNNLFCEYSLS